MTGRGSGRRHQRRGAGAARRQQRGAPFPVPLPRQAHQKVLHTSLSSSASSGLEESMASSICRRGGGEARATAALGTPAQRSRQQGGSGAGSGGGSMSGQGGISSSGSAMQQRQQLTQQQHLLSEKNARALCPNPYVPARPPPRLEDLEQRGEGGIDDALQRPPLLVVPELVLAGQEAQHVQRARDARLVLRAATAGAGGGEAAVVGGVGVVGCSCAALSRSSAVSASCSMAAAASPCASPTMHSSGLDAAGAAAAAASGPWPHLAGEVGHHLLQQRGPLLRVISIHQAAHALAQLRGQ